jgi:chorismate mutase
MEQEKFYIVNERALPEIFRKVMEVKESISLGKSKDVSDAIKKVGISRSTYYKYKDSIFPMDERLKSKKVTLIVLISHKAGALSKVLDCIAFHKANVLTINQDIPINMTANVSVTIDVSKMEKSISQLAARLNLLPNVISVKLLATE